jgi:hypothetical protein
MMLIRLAAVLALFAVPGAVLAQTAAPNSSAMQNRDASPSAAPQAAELEAARKGPLGSFRPLNQIACEFLGPCGKCDCSPVQTPQLNAPK